MIAKDFLIKPLIQRITVLQPKDMESYLIKDIIGCIGYN